MLFFLAIAAACLCERLNLTSSSCVNDTLVTSSIYNYCTYTQAMIDCNLMTCAEALPMNDYCSLTCECAPGCTLDMLSAGATYCSAPCDNDVCNHCTTAITSTGTYFFSNCPSMAPEVSTCINSIPTLDTCESFQAYVDCYGVHDCFADKITPVCQGLQASHPNCTFDCTWSDATFLHAAIALLFGL